jgi:hypothetical protein
MSVHARLGYPEQVGDLLRREATGDGAQDLMLAVGEAGDRARAPRKQSPRKEISGEKSDNR